MIEDDQVIIAVHVRKVDPPQFVAEDMPHLFEQFPGEWDGEQCDACGCPGYTIQKDLSMGLDGSSPSKADHPRGWVAVCSGYDFADDSVPGCGAEYRLFWTEAGKVTF